MKWEIRKNMYLESDGNNFLIRLYGTQKKDGKVEEVIKDVWYYTTLDSAIHGALKRGATKSNAKSLKEFRNEIREYVEDIKLKIVSQSNDQASQDNERKEAI